MWESIKETFRKVGRKLGLIENLKSVKDHKQINVSESKYKGIEYNKRLYAGKPVWLEYKGSKGNPIRRKRKSLNMSKVISKEMARLVFNEGVTMGVEAKGKKKQWELVEDVFTSNKFIREYQRYLEYMFALGGVVNEVYTDGQKPKIAYADATAVFPLSNDSEEVDEIAIANVFNQDGYTYTLVKWHEWGEYNTPDGTFNYRIKNELYEAREDTDDLGDKVALKKLYPDMEPATYFNQKHANFVYVKPNEANNKYMTSPLGVSIYENAHDTLEMLDVMFDFWWNEFRMGKRRVAVPEYMVQTNYNAQGKPYVTLDDSEELFVALNGSEMNEFAVKDLTVDIRSEQVIESIQALLDVLAMQTGFSPGTFVFKDGGVKTATQVVSENSKTYQTRSSHINTIEDGLRDLIVSVYEVAVMLLDEDHELKAADKLERMDVSINFDDGVFDDRDSRAEYYTKLYQDGVISDWRAIQKIHRLSEKDAKEWAKEIGIPKRKLDQFGKLVSYQLMPRLEAIGQLNGLEEETAAEWLRNIQLELRGLDPTEQQQEAEEELFGELE